MQDCERAAESRGLSVATIESATNMLGLERGFISLTRSSSKPGILKEGGPSRMRN